MKPKGWVKEPRRHSLASRGIKTAVKGKPVAKIPSVMNARYVGFKTLVEARAFAEKKGLSPTGYGYDSKNKHFFEAKNLMGVKDDDGWKKVHDDNIHKKVILYEKKGVGSVVKAGAIETDDEWVADVEFFKKTSTSNIPDGKIFLGKFTTKKEAEERIKKYMKEQRMGWKDSDGDGMPDNLDCDPNDPKKQGLFDSLAIGVASNLLTKTPDVVKEKRIRAKLEAREEELEKKKEQKLLKLNSRLEEKRALAEFKAKEKELDRLQDELDEGSFKQKLKAGAISVGKKTFILAKKGVKRVGEELAEKTPKKFTKVTLTDQEKDRTSNSTQKRLMTQQKKNAELEAKIELKNLKKEEKVLKQQLSSLQTKRKKRKKETGLFD